MSSRISNTTKIYENTTVIDLADLEVDNGTLAGLARLGFSGLSLFTPHELAF